MTPNAAQLIAAALRRRVESLPCAAAEGLTPQLGDAEAALTELMIRQLPRAERLSDLLESDRRALFATLCVVLQARSIDIRFLDALSRVYELLEARPDWVALPHWQCFLCSYRNALNEWIIRVERSLRRSDLGIECGPAVEQLEACEGHAFVPRAKLSVLVLADSVQSALRLSRSIESIEGVNLDLLICSNSARGRLFFWFRQGVQILLGGLSAMRYIVAGRLHIKSRTLHAAKVIEWLQCREFDLGLHAMGVIYRSQVIETFRLGLLNSHIGLLPTFRGRSVMEWSLLTGAPTGITVFFIDSGVDTGESIVLLRWTPKTGPAYLL